MTCLPTCTAMWAAVDPIRTTSWWFADTSWDCPLFRIPSKDGLVLSGPLACTQVSPPLALMRTPKTGVFTENVASVPFADTSFIAGVFGFAAGVDEVVAWVVWPTSLFTPLLV